jgi:hypothetical protein
MPTTVESKEQVAPHLAILIEDLPPIAMGWKDLLESNDVEIIASPISIPGLIEFLEDLNDADLSRTRLVILDKRFTLKAEGYKEGIILNFLKHLKDVNPESFVLERSGQHIWETFPHSDIAYNLEISDRRTFRKILKNQPSFYFKYLKFKTYLSSTSLHAQKIDPESEWCRAQGYSPTEEDMYKSSMKLLEDPLFPYLTNMLDLDEGSLYASLRNRPLNEILELLHDYWNIIKMREEGASSQEIRQTLTVQRIVSLLGNSK